mmetsp:Transcript_33645/g.41210  ORF Transcript_33645/g.41210 Transcript_33645/m.41210 type:complete len:218 (-) Transcript_33645:205-858(-)|eukprot:CAMPEP_0172501958 /NCGR_PEP_ID=MMETSP1066-20121228/155272_1 /TAXON_ID=671091 /ORGANISM="Coscinodiscus wailesii, Strain CCMP2513" /LENGTH=217 /DNA_ID=CAMNT_0013277029 /DNA_START=29 /DNA_END=682 /DNA_ORIENTATION=+
MTESKPLLGYWPIRAANRGAVNRYILGYSGVDYEEKRYAGAEEWANDKANLGMDFPNLPYIKNGDFYLTESKVVTAYICDKWAPDLIGSNPEERARILQTQEVLLEDFWKWFLAIFRTEDRDQVVKDGIKGMVKVAEALGDKEYLANGKLSFVDFILFELMETCNALAQDDRFNTAYPKLKAHHDRIAAIPKFAAYLASDKHLAGPFAPPNYAKIKF